MTTSPSVVSPVWEKTRLAVARVRGTPFYGPGGGPYGSFKGYHIIGRDSRILGGVSVGADEREAIAVEDDERLHDVYYALERRIQHYDAATYADVMEIVYDLVRERIPGDHKAVDQVVASWSAWQDGIVPLSAFLGMGGVCRHASLLSAYLVERLIDEEVIAGKVSTDRNAIPGEGGHMWTRFESPDGEVHILDTTVGYSGPEQGHNGKKPFWKYTRPMKAIRMQVRVARRYLGEGPSVPIVDDVRPWRHVGPNERPSPIAPGESEPDSVVPPRPRTLSEDDFRRQAGASRCRPRLDPPISARFVLTLIATIVLLVGGWLASEHLDVLRATASAVADRSNALLVEFGQMVERARTPDLVAPGTAQGTPSEVPPEPKTDTPKQADAPRESAKEVEPPGPSVPTGCGFAAYDPTTHRPVTASAPSIRGQYILQCREGLFAATGTINLSTRTWSFHTFTRLNERYEPLNGDH